MTNDLVDAAIVCRERDSARYELLLDVLREAGADSVAVFTRKDSGFLATRQGRQQCTWSEIAVPVSAVLVHQGDADIWTEKIRGGTVFWFDTVGRPQGNEGDLKIFRRTARDAFELTVSDAREILAYGKRERNSVPRCCMPKERPIRVPALVMLCKIYLDVYLQDPWEATLPELDGIIREIGWKPESSPNLTYGNREVVSSPEWWLSVLGFQRGNSMKDAWEAFMTDLQRELGGMSVPAEVYSLLDLEKLRSGLPINSALEVAKALKAITRLSTESPPT